MRRDCRAENGVALMYVNQKWLMFINECFAAKPISSIMAIALRRHPARYNQSGISSASEAGAISALDRLAIGHLAGRRLTELSGGQRQMVYLAQIPPPD